MSIIYDVAISVDNNRYGAYFKRYAKKIISIIANNKQEAYLKAANEVKRIPRYKNATIQEYDNNGDHDFSSWSINLDCVIATDIVEFDEE